MALPNKISSLAYSSSPPLQRVATAVSAACFDHYSFSISPSKRFQRREPELISLENLVGSRCKSGTLKIDEAVYLFNRIIQFRSPSIHPLNQLLKAMLKMKHHCTAISSFKLIDCKETKPDIFTLSILINCFCNIGRVDLGFSVLGSIFKRGLELDHVVLCSLLKGLCKVGNCIAALELLKDMEIKGSHKPGPVIYSTVIDGLCKNKELDKAFKLFKDMIHNNTLPDVVICNSLIHGLCNAGMLEEAVSFFAEIKNLGISPNVVGTVVDALSKDGRMAEALGLFELMSQSEGLQPDTRTYNSLIYGYCHLRAWKEALKLFDEMWGRKMSPNSATFSIIFIALCKEGMVNKAHYLLEVMIQNGVEPDVSMYNRLMDGYCLQGKMEEAVKAFDSVVGSGNEPNVLAIIF